MLSVRMAPGLGRGRSNVCALLDWVSDGTTCRGICFTYATMFALESLSLVGESHRSSERVQRACEFLVSKQKYDGGWGETYMASRSSSLYEVNLTSAFQSCVSGVYSDHETSQVVQTAWCILSLVYAQYPDKQVIRRAVALIMERQQPVRQASRTPRYMLTRYFPFRTGAGSRRTSRASSTKTAESTTLVSWRETMLRPAGS